MTMIEQFLDYLRYERRRSELTIKSYVEDLTAFKAFLKQQDNQLTWESVDSDVIRNWMESMMDHGNRATSVNRRLSALRSLYRYALSKHLVSHDPARRVTGPKRERPLPQFVRENEMDRLLDDIEWGTEYNKVRARTIIMMFYVTGIRLAELVGLDDSDVDVVNRQIKITGKGNKQRIMPYGEELDEVLDQYRSQRNLEVQREDDALFVTKEGRRMSPSAVRTEVKKHLSMVCTLKKMSPHVLRHTFATSMLNHGAGIESVRRLLGHESVSTTEIYTHTTFEQLRRVYQTAHPRADV